jgi:DNA-binding XRE family transcriptional regulator
MKSTPKEQLKGAVSAVSAASHLSGSIPDVRSLGDYIREQRNSSQISLRQLAKLAGVSNPYLSQIERGLRKPSAEILQQIAKALRISPRRCTSGRASSRSARATAWWSTPCSPTRA